MDNQLKFEGSWQRWLAFGFGSGFSPVAPGTVGTLIGIPIVLLLSLLPTLFFAIGAGLIALLSIWLAGLVTEDIGKEDHPAIVIDEIAGYVVTMAMIPLTWWSIITGFFIFRLFDIWKPPPIGWLDQNWHGGFGITADDLIAGVYANLVLQGLMLLIGSI